MENPFYKRATENLRDDEAFLAIVSPEPVNHFLAAHGENGSLYDRLVIIRGTPGSGKTTLARLFEFPTVKTLLRNSSIDSYQSMIAALVNCRAIEGSNLKFVGLRLPLETDYRDFWEFPYPEDLKAGLLTSMLQARAVLGWSRHILSNGCSRDNLEIIPREGSESAAEAIGGVRAQSFLERAKEIEARIYKIVGSLLPPKVEDLDAEITSVYRPFDVIEKFRITEGGNVTDLSPLIILDDAHSLHPEQFECLKRWLSRRELRVSRWILTRLDVLKPGEALAAVADRDGPRVELAGITASRDFVSILLQGDAQGRGKERGAFRKLARDMSDRYIRRMPVFNQRGLHRLKNLLSDEMPALSTTDMKKLRNSVAKNAKQIGIPDSAYADILSKVRAYLSSKNSDSSSIQLAMIGILVARFSIRNPQGDLFEQQRGDEKPKPLKVDISVFDAARLHLHHEYDFPYYYGLNDVCDGSSENAEQFLHLAAVLVESAVTRLIRDRAPMLDTKQQSRLLRAKASSVIAQWDFPYHDLVEKLTARMAKQCLALSLKPNAPLGAGANAYGVPQEEFDNAAKNNRELAQILKFGIAYNALTVVPRYSCKHKEWCLLELGGTVILKHGLTLKRGGFVESCVADLERFIEDSDDD